ncbi:ORF6N domain-containing protein [Bacillus cereus]|uniref:ORF6N domain-containing protein n=1 Tax=Bacillus cereus group TaxID=86661 RepID=UPI0022E991FD|nr:ORF6N domain-containing protein [Bacillus cereus]MCU5047574.1 ORF6N domain-containing protein [Bacillus cereus]MCU5651885.1 ORF6N domain-containing protein [Bacillus cereus]MDG1588951.1 ORF6N domain-containing protein [Bacillus cereus]MDZ4464674.1 ORF6N domain-containing protein [Bacillus cereus]HDR4446645.1 ORF6N domain-containing protein [Bacillus cereus]
MNKLQIIGKQTVAGYEFTGIEGGFGNDKKAMLVKEVAEIHGQPLKEINRRINTNRNRFKNGVDIIDLLSGSEPLRELAILNGWIGSNRTQNVYLLSERGYAKLLKILEDDTAWELYDKLVDGYFNMRKQQIDTTQLSPELQMFQTLFTTLATQELNQRKLEQKVDNISEIVALNSTDWRKDTTSILNKIARKQGGFEMYRKIRNESYEILEQRASAKLSIRVNNKKKSMALEGISKSKIDKVSNLDIIGEEKRLLEIYLAVVKEMAIRYQVNINEAI